MNQGIAFKEYAAPHAPALLLLEQLGYEHVPPAKALAMRGGRKSMPVLPHSERQGNEPYPPVPRSMPVLWRRRHMQSRTSNSLTQPGGVCIVCPTHPNASLVFELASLTMKRIFGFFYAL